MLSHTHDVQEPGSNQKVALCTCGSCGNVWWVVAALEHQPSYCPYCGIRFARYDDGNQDYGMTGLPLTD